MNTKVLQTVLGGAKPYAARHATQAAAVFLLFALTAALASGSFLMSHAWDAIFAAGPRAEAPSGGASSAEEALPFQAAGASLGKAEPLTAALVDTETLWLARCIYSETKRPEEQELVAWVVRNRVETSYRGAGSYREVVLDPYQFSAFNPGSPKRTYYASLDPFAQARGWQRALFIAREVKKASIAARPFPQGTRHFFSERSMDGGRHPSWAARGTKVTPARHGEVPAERFRFYAAVR